MGAENPFGGIFVNLGLVMPDVLLDSFYVKKSEDIQKLTASSPEPPTYHGV